MTITREQYEDAIPKCCTYQSMIAHEEMMVKKAEVSATWDISLNCDCPKCGDFVDLLRDDNFLDNHERLKPIENGTEQSNNLEVVCPECGHEFEVCCEY